MKIDKNKIAVIVCVNNEKLFQETLFFLNKQFLDAADTMQIIPVRGASSITAGYNAAMTQTDAKYKLYIHQDVFLVYSHAISELLALFRKYNDIGMVGMIGSDKISANGCWWENGEAHGAYIDSHDEKMGLYEVNQGIPFAEVKMMDGFFLATQYDIYWREDIFDGWHFYDASQCMEFLRNGYRLAVPYQKNPWCVHDCGQLFGYKYEYSIYQERFIHEYGHDQRLFKKSN